MKRIFMVAALALVFLLKTGVSSLMAADVVVADGKTVSFDYTLTVDGAVVDNSQGKKPLQYVQGQKKIILGLEKQLAGLKIGDQKKIVVSPEEAYGKVDPKAVQEVDRALIPKDTPLTVGTILEATDPSGHAFPAKITEIKDKTVMLDLNHPLAGKELTFDVKIVDIK